MAQVRAAMLRPGCPGKGGIRVWHNQIIMESHISATHAARNLSDLISRVRYRGEEFVIERGGAPVCRLVPARGPARFTGADLKKLLASIPKPDADYWETLEDIVRNQPELPEDPWRS